MQEIAWRDVSKRCGESEDLCRKRWRNLKTSTARYLKQLRTPSKSSNVKEYYLYEKMKFAIPYLKNKDEMPLSTDSKSPPPQPPPPSSKSTSSYHIKQDKSDDASDDESYQYEIIEADGGYIVTRPSDDTVESDAAEDATTEFITSDMADSQKDVTVEQQTAKRPKLLIENKTVGNVSEIHEEIPVLCSDELFLKSLIPDIMLMNAEQKRKFKIGVLSLVDKILSD